MPDELTSADLDLLLESLRYTRLAFERYGGYADEAQRSERLAAVDSLRVKLRQLAG